MNSSLPRDIEGHLRIAILAGGIGSRFWPASTPARPKQLLALASERPLIVDTLERARGLAPDERISILTGEHLVPPFRSALPDLPHDAIWVEPRARGTAPVLAWAAHRMAREDPDAIMVSLHADHLIEPEDAFRTLVPRAAALARQEDLLLTIAVPPDRPETGYGYIRPGAEIVNESGFRGWRVGAFVEKPEHETAVRYVKDGYLWNSGIFIWTVSRFLEEIRMHAPELGAHLPLLDEGRDEAFFERAPSISVDEAVLERSGRVGTVEATFRWDDVGGWEALQRTTPTDEWGNAVMGEVHTEESEGCIVWAEDGPVVLFGVEKLVVVRSGGMTLVLPRERAADLKSLLASLPESLRRGG